MNIKIPLLNLFTIFDNKYKSINLLDFCYELNYSFSILEYYSSFFIYYSIFSKSVPIILEFIVVDIFLYYLFSFLLLILELTKLSVISNDILY